MNRRRGFGVEALGIIFLATIDSSELSCWGQAEDRTRLYPAVTYIVFMYVHKRCSQNQRKECIRKFGKPSSQNSVTQG